MKSEGLTPEQLAEIELYYPLRERYSPKPAPKCPVCGEEMSMQRISGSHVVYACSGMEDDGCFKTGRTYADEHYKNSRISVVDGSDPDVIELLDENVEMALTLEKLRVELEAAKKCIAELESNRATLAAENIALKSAHPQQFGQKMMDALVAYEECQDDVPERGMLNAFFILRDSVCIDTPATGAFLAEVRAGAFNDLCAAFVRDARGVGLDDDELVTLKDATGALLHCAEQLREGGNQ